MKTPIALVAAGTSGGAFNGTDANAAGPPDGTPVVFTDAGGGGTLTLRFQFANPVVEPSLVLYGFGANQGGDVITLDAVSNPEPSTIALFAVGCLCLVGRAESAARLDDPPSSERAESASPGFFSASRRSSLVFARLDRSLRLACRPLLILDGQSTERTERMMKTFVVAAALVFGAGATNAFAAFQYAASSSFDAGDSTGVGAGFTATTPGNGAGAPDGNFITLTNATGGTSTAVLQFTFNSTVHTPGLILYSAGSTGTATITEIRWSNSSYAAGAFASQNVSVPGGPTDIFLGGGSFSGGPGGAGFVADLNSIAFVTITLTNGSTFTVDAVSNPEPAAMALFALGAAGLGGFAWKRRKARVVAKK